MDLHKSHAHLIWSASTHWWLQHLGFPMISLTFQVPWPDEFSPCAVLASKCQIDWPTCGTWKSCKLAARDVGFASALLSRQYWHWCSFPSSKSAKTNKWMNYNIDTFVLNISSNQLFLVSVCSSEHFNIIHLTRKAPDTGLKKAS